MKCTTCLRELRADALFCDRCGAAVGTGAAAATANDPERRWVTILFCDLVGSVALAERLEPEDMRTLLGVYQRACKAAVEQHGGSIARFVGDGLLVYFGYPESHEDAPHRAVRAALGIVAAIRGQTVRVGTHGVDLQVRIGLETGPVLIGDIDNAASLERAAAVGTVPNIAARLQSLAPPNGIVVGPGTYQRIRGTFDCRSSGEVVLKGIARPVAAYTVVAEGKDMDLRNARRAVPLVERDAERERLNEAWARAKHSVPGLLNIRGEAGVGKSRLLRALLDDLQGDNFNHIGYQCSAQQRGTPLSPAAMHLRAFAGIEPRDAKDLAFSKLKESAARIGLPQESLLPLAVLLGVEPKAASTAPSPAPTRAEILGSLESLVAAFVKQAPTLMVVEDAHWCDPSTLEFLGSLARRMPRRLLLLVTHRQEFMQPWADVPASSTLELGRLSSDASRAMVEGLLASGEVPRPLVDRVLARAEGIPLFLEEFASLVLDFRAEHGDGQSARDFSSLTIPDSLQESLAARLDRMGPAKRVAQVAAAFGRSFSPAVLSALPDFEGVAIQDNLQELSRKGLLTLDAGIQPGDHEFSHALIRDAAYQSLARDDRQGVHCRIADTLLASFPEVTADRPELVAFHLTEGAARERAVEFWFQAGGRSMQRLANLEAIEHLHRGIALLNALPAAQRPMQELRFLTALMPALCATRGYANLEVQQTFTRAYDLCIELGLVPELAPILYALFTYFLVRADLDRTQQVTRDMQRIAVQSGDALRRMEVALAVGVTRFYQGRLAEAEASLDEVLALWTPEGPQFFAAGEDIRASTKSWLGLVHWHQGDFDRARQVAQESLYRARQVDQPISLSFSMYFNVFLAQFCRDVHTVDGLGSEALALCIEKSIFWGTLCEMHLGWAQMHAAGTDRQAAQAGTRRMIGGLGGFRAAGARLTQTYYLSMVAEGQLAGGEFDACERTLTEATACAEETGEDLWRSELLRLRAELTLARHAGQAQHTADAEALFIASLTQARALSARGLELRSALGLARLLAALDRYDEIGPLLKPLLAAIRCIGETADVRQARALVEA